MLFKGGEIMPVYSISYDLYNVTDDKYDKLKKNIEDYCSVAIKYCESSWIVKCSGSAEGLKENLRKVLNDEDVFLVIKVVSDYSGWLPKNLWPKINNLFD